MKKAKLSIPVFIIAAFCLKTSCGNSNQESSFTDNSEPVADVETKNSRLESKKVEKTKKEKAKDALVLAGATVAGAATAIMIPKALPKVGKAVHAALDSVSKSRKLPRGILDRADTWTFIAWAQPLDNVADEIIHLNGKALTSKLNQPKRVESVNFANSIRKRTIIDTKNLLITTNSDAFMLEVTPREKDIAGRLAPVVFAGQIPKYLPSDYIGTRQDLILDELNRFLKTINRTIADTEMNAIKGWLSDLE